MSLILYRIQFLTQKADFRDERALFLVYEETQGLQVR